MTDPGVPPPARTAGPARRFGHHAGMPSAPRNPRLVALYAVLLLLLVVSGLLAVGGRPFVALVVLGVATLLNVRMLALRNRLYGGPGK